MCKFVIWSQKLVFQSFVVKPFQHHHFLYIFNLVHAHINKKTNRKIKNNELIYIFKLIISDFLCFRHQVAESTVQPEAKGQNQQQG